MGNCNAREKEYQEENDLPSFSTSVLHNGPVLGMDYFNGMIASSSEDKNIALTTANSIISPQTSTKYLKGHTKPINCVKFGKKNQKVYSASRDLSVRVVRFTVSLFIFFSKIFSNVSGILKILQPCIH